MGARPDACLINRGAGASTKLRTCRASLAVEMVVFHDEDPVFQASSRIWEVTTRSNCFINGSRQECCFRKSDSACARTYFSSSFVRSLLVRTNTGRSAVRGLLRHSASNSKPLILVAPNLE